MSKTLIIICHSQTAENERAIAPANSELQTSITASLMTFSLVQVGVTQIITVTNTGPFDAYDIEHPSAPDLGLSELRCNFTHVSDKAVRIYYQQILPR